jgi:hypothetical protein
VRRHDGKTKAVLSADRSEVLRVCGQRLAGMGGLGALDEGHRAVAFDRRGWKKQAEGVWRVPRPSR